MGGGGTSGEVEFPDYVMDSHGDLFAGTLTDGTGAYSSSPSTANQSVIASYNSAIGANPYGGYFLQDPAASYSTGDIVDLRTFVSNFGTDRIEDILTSALYTVNPSNPTRAVQDLIAESDEKLSNASPLKGPVTTPGLSLGNKTEAISLFGNKSDAIALLSSRTNAAAVLNDAVTIAETIANTSEITDIVSAFRSRRENRHQEEIARYNAQMADANATSSSAYMFGQALLDAEHSKEEAQFDKEITHQAFTRALAHYVESYAQNLQADAEIEAQDTQLKARYVGLRERYASLEANYAEIESRYDQLRAQYYSEYNQTLGQERQLHEQRYLRTLKNTVALLTNEGEFSRALAQVNLQHEDSYHAAYDAYDQLSLESDHKEEMWDLMVGEQAANILSAPQGMARRLPEAKSKTEKIAGMAIQGVAAAGTLAAGISDRRMKENLRQVGVHTLGFGIYLFDYKWGPSDMLGCIAQEVGEVLPEAVGQHRGDLFVRYNLV